MSSHHFVRDGQEPALFIVEAFSFQLAEPFLEWVPFVIVTEAAVEDVLRWGIKIDMVLQQTTPLNVLEEKLNDQSPVHIAQGNGDRDVVLEGLQYLVQNRYNASNIMTTPSEHLLKKLENVWHQLQINVFNQTHKWSAVTSGKFEKWIPEGSNINIWPNSLQGLRLNGLIAKGSTWEAIQGGIITIEAEAPFWVEQTL